MAVLVGPDQGQLDREIQARIKRVNMKRSKAGERHITRLKASTIETMKKTLLRASNAIVGHIPETMPNPVLPEPVPTPKGPVSINWTSMECPQIAILDAKYNVYQGPYSCKDYIQDHFASMYNGGKSTSAYGNSYVSNAIPCFNEDYLYMGSMAKDIHSKVENIQSVLNQFEAALKFRPSTVMPAQKNSIVVKYSKEWTEKGYLLSLLCLLIRSGQTYDHKNVLEWLDAVTTFTQQEMGNKPWTYTHQVYTLKTPNGSDNGYLVAAKERIKKILTGEFNPPQPWTLYLNGGNGGSHGSSGIVGFNPETTQYA